MQHLLSELVFLFRSCNKERVASVISLNKIFFKKQNKREILQRKIDIIYTSII
jgi:hypothetical protein